MSDENNILPKEIEVKLGVAHMNVGKQLQVRLKTLSKHIMNKVMERK